MIDVACLKWVDQRPEPATVFGTGLANAAPDERFAGVSASDQAGLEWALRTRATRETGSTVLAITVGPDGADAVLRDALAAGADRAIRIDLPFGAPSRAVANAIAGVLRDVLAATGTVWCGDHSFDRGTGSVPAFLAGELGIVQALGLVAVEHTAAGPIEVLRRLDGGRRERLAIDVAAVLSVEGSTASLRRASLRGVRDRPAIEVFAGETTRVAPPGETRPYRPRARIYAPPAGQTALERVKALTAAGSAAAAHGETVTLEPHAAADRILTALAEWGHLP